MLIGKDGAGVISYEPGIALLDAAEHGVLSEVRRLLKHKLVAADDAVYAGWTALHLACRAGNLPVINFLLKNGADLDAATEENKYTALQLSAWNGHEPVVEILLTCGVEDVEAKDSNGQTALRLAKAARHAGVVRLIEESKQ